MAPHISSARRAAEAATIDCFRVFILPLFSVLEPDCPVLWASRRWEFSTHPEIGEAEEGVTIARTNESGTIWTQSASKKCNVAAIP